MILIKQIVFAMFVIVQFSIIVYYRVMTSRRVRSVADGGRDRWLRLRNTLIIATVLPTFFSVDTVLSGQLSEKITFTSAALGTLTWLSSILLYVWSRNVLSAEFNPSVVIYQNHKLVTSGPYSICRHPIYLSYLGSFVGALLVTFSFSVIIGGGIGVIWMLARIGSEEQKLIREFGNAYIEYQKRTGMLFPKIG